MVEIRMRLFYICQYFKIEKKTNFKLLNNYKKYGENEMVADVTQCERSNIKCYASTFNNIQMHSV